MTEEKLAQDSFRWTFEVVETAVDGIITIDERGIIQYWNRAAQKMFGYGPEEVLGQNVKVLMPSPYQERHDGYLSHYLGTGERRIIGIGRNVLGKRKDGTTFPMHLAVSEVRVGEQRLFTGIVHDKTEEVIAQLEKDKLLTQLNRRNRELNCLYRLGEMVRYGALDETAFQEMAELIHHALSHQQLTGIRLTLDNREYTDEPFQRTPWRVSAPILVEGRERGVVEAYFLEPDPAVESTEDREQDTELVQSVARSIGGAVERRESEAKVLHASKLASIGELAAGVGHEINNPVNGIINCADIIIENTPAETRANKYAKLIHSEAERIAAIVRSLLTYSRQDKEQYSLASFSDIIDTVMSLCGKKLAKSHIEYRISLPRDLPKIPCRSEQIQQVLMNLILNAMHALDDKYPGSDPDKLLLIEVATVKKDGASRVRVMVEDHGTGIPPAHVERIFDPFFTTKGRDVGTGLGLSVSHGIVLNHGGNITMESELGKFTRFYVELPMEPAKR